MSAPSGILFNGAALVGAGPHLALADSPSAGELLGTLSAVDADAGDSFTYELLDDAGGLFFLTGNLLRRSAGGVLDPDAAAYTLRLRVTDAAGLSFETDAVLDVAALDVTIRKDGTDGNDVQSSGPEQEFFLATPGDDTIDTDGSDFVVYSGRRADYAFVYTPGVDGYGGYGGYGGGGPTPDTLSVVDLRSGGPDGADLIINPAILRFSDGDVFGSSLDIGRPALTVTGQDLVFDAYVPENVPAGYVIGTLSALGLDPGEALNILSFDVLSFRNVSGFPVAETTTTFFTIDAEQRLVTLAPLDFERFDLHYVNIDFIDDAGNTWRDSILLDVLDTPDAPFGALLLRDAPGGGRATVAEHANRTADVLVGRLEFIDQDGAPDGYSITVAPAFASDFYVVGDLVFLRRGALIDFETDPTVTIDLIVQDLTTRPDQTVTLTAAFDVTFAALQGTTGPDAIVGTAGDDAIFGLAGGDQLSGGLGNDTLLGGLGADLLRGGEGDDLLIADLLFPSTALRWTEQATPGTSIAAGFVQTIGSVDATVTVDLFGDGAAQISNTNIYVAGGEGFSPNSLYLTSGTAGPTSNLTIRFSDLGGSATVSGVAFRLLDLDAGSHQDIVTVTAFAVNGTAVPVLLTPNGEDLILGNTVTGAPVGNDFDSATGSILVSILGPVHEIVVSYGNGLSAFQTFGISDVHFFTPSDAPGSRLFGDAGIDTLMGGTGNDSLDGGLGADSMEGGAGNDSYTVDDSGDVIVERAGAGNDRVVASISYVLGAELERLALSGTADLNGTGNALANRLDGNAGANILDGGEANDALNGGADNDTLIGGLGNDTLTGGLGTDSLEGGEGNDTYNVDDLTDMIEEATGGGTDRVVASISYALGAELERLSLSGVADLNGTGNALDNRLDGNAGANTLDGGEANDGLFGFGGDDALIGGAGNDTLDGGLGADSMAGGAGNDVYFVDDLLDVVLEGAGGGYDRILATISTTLGTELERLSLSGTADLDGTGNALANRLDGNTGANTLDGGEGLDGLYGLAGNDTLIGGGGKDTLDGGLGADRLEGGLGNDIFLFNSASEAHGDVIADFSLAQGDRIDLRPMDADTTSLGNQGFSWIGNVGFSNVAGQLRFAGGLLEGDVDGDGGFDFQIALSGGASLTATNIWL